MAKRAAHGSRMWIDEVEQSSVLNSFDLAITQETPLVTTFADEGPRRVVGNYDHEHNDLGIFDGGVNRGDAVIHALLSDNTDHYLARCPGSANEGDVAYESIVALASKPLSGRVGDAVILNRTYRGRGGMVRGVLLSNATILGTGARTGQNLGATVSGQRLRVVHRIVEFTGTSLTVQFQESTDNGSGDAYATITGMGFAGMATTGIVVGEVTIATEAWKRLLLSGSFASVTLVTTVGIVLGT